LHHFCCFSGHITKEMPDRTKETYTHQKSPKKETPDMTKQTYGVATVSRIDKIIGLFCRILSLL